jgi:hypothetical protein
METITKKVNAKSLPKTLSEMIQELEVGKALAIPLKRRVGAMSIITYWKRVNKFEGRTFKSRKKDKKTCYIIRIT